MSELIFERIDWFKGRNKNKINCGDLAINDLKIRDMIKYRVIWDGDCEWKLSYKSLFNSVYNSVG